MKLLVADVSPKLEKESDTEVDVSHKVIDDPSQGIEPSSLQSSLTTWMGQPYFHAGLNE